MSGSCPLQLHKYQKGLNKLLAAVKVVSEPTACVIGTIGRYWMETNLLLMKGLSSLLLNLNEPLH